MSNVINKFERKIIGKGIVRVGKGFTLFISNEDMDDIIRIIRSLEDLAVLIDEVNETEKHEIKKEEGGFPGALLASLADSIVKPVISLVVTGINVRKIREVGGGFMNKDF